MSNKPTRGKGMKPKIKTISAEDLKKFLEKDGLLFTSQDLANMLGVTEGALRKQRSKFMAVKLMLYILNIRTKNPRNI